MAWTAQEIVAWTGAAVIGFCLYRGWRAYYRMRALADTPIAKIRSAHQGYVELKGRAELLPGPPILSPLTGLPCAWYRFWEEKRTGQGGGWWVVNKGMSDSLFLLVDDTGRCVLDPDGAEFINARQRRWYVAENGVPIHTILGIGAHYRYTEQRILPGDEIHAIGFFSTVGGVGDALATKQEVARLLERWKKDPQRMALFDRNNNGRIDPEEWDAARRAAHRQVQREQLQRSLEPETHLLSNPDDPEQPFLIAAVAEERRLIHRYRLRLIVYLAAALAVLLYLLGVFPPLF